MSTKWLGILSLILTIILPPVGCFFAIITLVKSGKDTKSAGFILGIISIAILIPWSIILLGAGAYLYGYYVVGGQSQKNMTVEEQLYLESLHSEKTCWAWRRSEQTYFPTNTTTYGPWQSMKWFFLPCDTAMDCHDNYKLVLQDGCEKAGSCGQADIDEELANVRQRIEQGLIVCSAVKPTESPS